MEKTRIAYDLRAMDSGTDDASVLCAYANGETIEQVKREVAEDFGSGVIYCYDQQQTTKGVILINETFEAVVVPDERRQKRKKRRR